MIKHSFIGFAALVILLSSCSKKPDYVFSNDMDNFYYWNSANCPNTIEGDAHSGKYKIYMDSIYQYSLVFKGKLSDFADGSLQKIEASAWCLTKDTKANVNLVVTIKRGEESFLYEKMSSMGFTTELNKWSEMKYILDFSKLEKKPPMDAEVYIYLWNENKLRMEIDDFTISVFK